MPTAKGRLLIGIGLLAIAWAFANPPFAAPDERDHYVRAVGIGGGMLVGDPAPGVAIGYSPAEIAYDRHTQRAVNVPSRLDPAPYNCYVLNPRMPAGCLKSAHPDQAPARLITSVGTYPPLALLAPGAVVRTQDDPLDAVRIGRVVAMVGCLLLLVFAAWVLYEPTAGWLSLTGLIAACTPMTIFLAASLTPSGLEVSAAIGLTAALIRLARPSRASTWVWALMGSAGAVLVLSHPTGLGVMLLLLIGAIAFVGPRAVGRLVDQNVRRAWPGLMVLGLGTVASVYWHLRYGAPVRVEVRHLDVAARQTPGNYWDFVRQLVGVFGYLEYRLPKVLYSVWFGLVAALTVAALVVGSVRGRRAVLIAAGVSVFLPITFWVFLGRAIGSGMSGRQFLPLLVAFPIVCGEIVYRNRRRLTARAETALAGLVIAAGVVQFFAWYLNGRRSAVGVDGSLLFPFHAQWTPPLGWAPWLVCAALGALLLSTVPVRRIRRPWRIEAAHKYGAWPIPGGSTGPPKSVSGHPAV